MSETPTVVANLPSWAAQWLLRDPSIERPRRPPHPPSANSPQQSQNSAGPSLRDTPAEDDGYEDVPSTAGAQDV